MERLLRGLLHRLPHIILNGSVVAALLVLYITISNLTAEKEKYFQEYAAIVAEIQDIDQIIIEARQTKADLPEEVAFRLLDLQIRVSNLDSKKYDCVELLLIFPIHSTAYEKIYASAQRILQSNDRLMIAVDYLTRPFLEQESKAPVVEAKIWRGPTVRAFLCLFISQTT